MRNSVMARDTTKKMDRSSVHAARQGKLPSVPPCLRGESSTSVRGEYARYGVEEWYGQFGATYRNPHESIVRELIQVSVRDWSLDLSAVLDLAAGSGEATLALRDVGAVNVSAIDPYTGPAYLVRTGKSAEALTFADLAAGALAGRRYSLVVCSFALHLCEPSRLAGLMFALAQVTPALLILTPNKRPQLRAEWGWIMRGERLMNRVRSRIYQRKIDPDTRP